MNKLNIGLIFGGMSGEHEVSCESAASIIQNIDTEKYNLVKIWIDKQGVWYVYDGPTEHIAAARLAEKPADAVLSPAVFSPCSVTHGLLMLDKVNEKYSVVKLDCVLPIIHGTTGEDGVLQGLLELSGIPYVGCKTASSAVCMDKAITKVILSTRGINQADWLLFRKSELERDLESATDAVCAKFGFPLFVKPAGTGSSVGVSKAYNRDELKVALLKAANFDAKVLVEEFIDGREIELALLEGEDGLSVSRCGEVKPGSDFYDYDDKYKNGVSTTEIPAKMPAEIAEKMRETAKIIFRALDCRGFARCDFFLRGDEIVFNEINTLPGFTKISMYPRLVGDMGISYRELITRLIEYARAAK